ncbi:MAG: acylphosphatase [Planctomycetales bacterium]|nr:acylphosphatase [Planctomycetales bacterium]
MTSSTLQRRQITYSGEVQGVGFRYTTRMIARGYDVNGYVRNLPDRRVELVVEGAEDQIDGFLAEIAERMSGQIRNSTCDTRPSIDEFAGFEIRY